MSVRDLPALALVLGLASFAGCGGGTTKDATDATDATPGDDDDDDDDNRESEGGGGFFDAQHAVFSAQFTYDSATYSLVELNYPGYGAVPGTIDIKLGTPEWLAAGLDSARDDLYCVVSLVLDDSTIPGWVTKSETLWYGVDFTGGTGGTNCNEPGYELDPNIWGADPFADIASYEGWGIAVGDPSPEVVEFIDKSLKVEDQPNIFGGTMMNPMLGEAYMDNGDMWSYTFVVDAATFEPYDDGSGYYTFISAADANLGNNIATGWYQVNDLYYWTFSF